MINQTNILQATHYGFSIYQRVLSYYYEDSLALGLSGKQCLPARNPFNEGKKTLRISLQDDVFVYQDYELPDFNGDAFDFAALHYQLQGDELLEKINQELHLHLEVENGSIEQLDIVRPIFPIFVIEMPCFSFYNNPITNTKPSKHLTLLEVNNLIKGPDYKDRTLKLRSITDPDAASHFKKSEFDCVTFSGVFSKRSSSSLVNHSGLLTLDFDHVENLDQKKQDLLDDPKSDLLIDLLFDSPSGHGFKSIISIDVMQFSHQQWFESLSHFLKKRYNLELDRSGKDVSRACFLPHDPNVWIHPIYLT